MTLRKVNAEKKYYLKMFQQPMGMDNLSIIYFGILLVYRLINIARIMISNGNG